MMKEKFARLHPRYSFDGRVSVATQRPEGKVWFWGLIANLSKGGMAATVVGDFRQDEVVTLRFSLGQISPQMEIRARVCHQHGYYCGLEFLRLSDAQRKCIENACDELSRKT